MYKTDRVFFVDLENTLNGLVYAGYQIIQIFTVDNGQRFVIISFKQQESERTFSM